MTDEQYGEAREKWQGRLAKLVRDSKFKKMGVVAVFEGNDAAGKGGRHSPRDAGARRAPLPRASPSPPQRRRSARSRTCGASGDTSRASGASRSSTAPGTGASSSSASRGSAAERTGCARTARSTTSRRARRARHRRREVLARDRQESSSTASASARRRASSDSRSPTRTGATARSGTRTSARCATWSTARARSTHPGRSSKRTTSTSRGSGIANGVQGDRGPLRQSTSARTSTRCRGEGRRASFRPRAVQNREREVARERFGAILHDERAGEDDAPRVLRMDRGRRWARRCGPACGACTSSAP